ncbi:hypothetical protein RFI_00166 [Reticulomyxa filosa]|uniref:Uncharacterized protein n=1 Tax=Reticulomyxa filosa TaxID=46433 RepID=X6PGV3_RETFI|nr:hypothetical protein RFI_00166 [Reticulomyxa filosa]|eukprot:ETO36897.1 hypothetical protein RFI_00166 [Reticulomyxa filosa]
MLVLQKNKRTWTIFKKKKKKVKIMKTKEKQMEIDEQRIPDEVIAYEKVIENITKKYKHFSEYKENKDLKIKKIILVQDIIKMKNTTINAKRLIIEVNMIHLVKREKQFIVRYVAIQSKIIKLKNEINEIKKNCNLGIKFKRNCRKKPFCE